MIRSTGVIHRGKVDWGVLHIDKVNWGVYIVIRSSGGLYIAIRSSGGGTRTYTLPAGVALGYSFIFLIVPRGENKRKCPPSTTPETLS